MNKYDKIFLYFLGKKSDSMTFVTTSDIRNISMYQEQTLLVLKTPPGATFHYPTPVANPISGAPVYLMQVFSEHEGVDVHLLSNDLQSNDEGVSMQRLAPVPLFSDRPLLPNTGNDGLAYHFFEPSPWPDLPS